MYINNHTIELFDSGGRSFIKHPYINQLLKYHSDKKFVYNKKQIQAIESDLCGQFCCLFALIKAKHKQTHKFISYFNLKKNLKDNNYLVLSLFKKHFNCTKIICGKNSFKKIAGKKVQICVNLGNT